MRLFFTICFTLFILTFSYWSFYFSFEKKIATSSADEIEAKPNDWFFQQRAYPYEDIPLDVYRRAQLQAKFEKQTFTKSSNDWESRGPVNIGGRITDVEMHSSNMDVVYAGAANGGVWKSVDGGREWESIFDEALSLSIGDIAVAPSDADILYVGTGEANAGGGSLTYDGMGMFRSNDGGGTWQHLGLESSRTIGRVAVHPQDPDIVFVGALGRAFSTDGSHGVFRSVDGGEIWENVLYVSDSTGCVDIAIHPTQPNMVFAALWERTRKPNNRDYGGQTSGIYRSIDGGDTWTELQNGLPHEMDLGRIGLAIAPSEPDIIYASVIDYIGNFVGIYKSIDRGDSWLRVDETLEGLGISSFGWWFGNIRVAPDDANTVYFLDLGFYRSTNGGKNWSGITKGMHVDQHGLYIHPQNPDFMILGNDGGIYKTTNNWSSWSHVKNMPITQFYTCTIDEQNPDILYGGTQDNGTWRTVNASAGEFEFLFGGDGFYVNVDPTDSRYVYVEYQYGNLFRSTNGGNSFSRADFGIPQQRRNWNTPIVFEPNNPSTLYYGGNRLYKSTNRASNWQAISPDLSNGGVSGPYSATYGSITTIAVSPIDTDIMYAGTDDSNVWATYDGGQDWVKVSDELPNRWVTRVVASLDAPLTAYVCFSGFRYSEYLPHIFQTNDGGNTWLDISGNLPEVPVNDIIIDPNDANTLYVATDVGVYHTNDLGQSWEMLGSKLPNVTVNDLSFHEETRTLLAATYGRSLFTYDLKDITSIDEERNLLEESFLIYPNPIRHRGSIEFQLLKPQNCRLELYDLQGRLIQTCFEGKLSIGQQRIDIEKGNWTSGSYILRIYTENQILAKQVYFE